MEHRKFVHFFSVHLLTVYNTKNICIMYSHSLLLSDKYTLNVDKSKLLIKCSFHFHKWYTFNDDLK